MLVDESMEVLAKGAGRLWEPIREELMMSSKRDNLHPESHRMEESRTGYIKK